MAYGDYECSDCGSTICPYCLNEEHWTGDPIGDDGKETKTECGLCGKEFTVQVSISVEHHCYPIEEFASPCKQDGEGK